MEKLKRDLRIFVATNKDIRKIDLAAYEYILVGKETIDGYNTDKTLDNISDKNDFYRELTAVYWIWKNVGCEYVGFIVDQCFFVKKILNLFHYSYLDEKAITKILSNHDLIIPKKTNLNTTVRKQYNREHIELDYKIASEVLIQLYPDYKNALDIINDIDEISFFNVFIGKKEILDKYFEWIFRILFEVEKRIDPHRRNAYQKKVYWYLAERYFNVWLHKNNHLRIKYIPVVNIKENPLRNTLRYYYRRIFK